MRGPALGPRAQSEEDLFPRTEFLTWAIGVLAQMTGTFTVLWEEQIWGLGVGWGVSSDKGNWRCLWEAPRRWAGNRVWALE